MNKLENAIISLNSLRSENNVLTRRDPRAIILVTVFYLVALLSISLTNIPSIIWMGIYPILLSQISAGGYSGVLRKSLLILPFILLIGIFNPILDRQPLFRIGETVVTRGWVTFISVILRGLWAVQAAIALTEAVSFTGLCRGLGRLGVPGFLTIQLMMIYRYLTLLLEESLRMKRARESRGFGRKNLPLKMWGVMVGELFVRSIDRSRNIHSAMVSRGFNGVIPTYGRPHKWEMGDTIFLISWIIIILILRILPPELVFSKII